MDMYLNYSPIKVEELEKAGFTVEEHDYLSSVQYNGNEAVVLIEKDKSGEKYVTDISQERGINNKEVIRKIYEIFDLNLIDECSEDFEDILHWEKSKDELLHFMCMCFERTKKEIIGV